MDRNGSELRNKLGHKWARGGRRDGHGHGLRRRRRRRQRRRQCTGVVEVRRVDRRHHRRHPELLDRRRCPTCTASSTRRSPPTACSRTRRATRRRTARTAARRRRRTTRSPATRSTAATVTSSPTTSRGCCPSCASNFGEFAVGLVFAHELGHAVQARVGYNPSATVYLEQQADCFAGAWAQHVAEQRRRERAPLDRRPRQRARRVC